MSLLLCKSARNKGVRPIISYASGSAPFLRRINAATLQFLTQHQWSAVIKEGSYS